MQVARSTRVVQPPGFKVPQQRAPHHPPKSRGCQRKRSSLEERSYNAGTHVLELGDRVVVAPAHHRSVVLQHVVSDAVGRKEGYT